MQSNVFSLFFICHNLHRRNDGQYAITVQEVYLIVCLHFVKPDNKNKVWGCVGLPRVKSIDLIIVEPGCYRKKKLGVFEVECFGMKD